jgi:hypothetical protein
MNRCKPQPLIVKCRFPLIVFFLCLEERSNIVLLAQLARLGRFPDLRLELLLILVLQVEHLLQLILVNNVVLGDQLPRAGVPDKDCICVLVTRFMLFF